MGSNYEWFNQWFDLITSFNLTLLHGYKFVGYKNNYKKEPWHPSRQCLTNVLNKIVCRSRRLQIYLRH